jgi:hypothetical protein
MRDQHDDLIHQALRQDFASDVGRLIKSIVHAFDRLNARLYDAPWLNHDQAAKPTCKQGFTAL